MLANENFYALFAQHVAADAAAPCLVTTSGERLNRDWLDRTSAQYANALVRLGLTPGERVAVQAEKSAELLAFYLGCLRAGVCFTPLNTAYTREETRHLLADCAPTLVISQLEGLESIASEAKRLSLAPDGTGSARELREGLPTQFDTLSLDGEAIATILYTSGTTGQPKGAMMSHRSLRAAATGLVREWEFTSNDVLLHALPLFHGHGLFISSNVALSAGSTLIFADRFDPDVVTQNLPYATVFMGVPTYYHRLLASPAFTANACRNIRLLTCGSAPLPVDILSEVESRVGHRIVERYGATEAMIISSNPMQGERRNGTVGRVLEGVELRIVGADDTPLPDGEIGAIQIRGPSLFSGYWGRPDATDAEFTEDSFFRTGDLGVRAADGYVTVTGRSKDLIISGGYNVYPAEVEAALRELASVADVAVVGRPDPDFGEVAVAFVVPAPTTPQPTSEELRAWAKSRVANYKVPKEFRFIEELPRNALGKVLKAELRNRINPSASKPLK